MSVVKNGIKVLPQPVPQNANQSPSQTPINTPTHTPHLSKSTKISHTINQRDVMQYDTIELDPTRPFEVAFYEIDTTKKPKFVSCHSLSP